MEDQPTITATTNIPVELYVSNVIYGKTRNADRDSLQSTFQPSSKKKEKTQKDLNVDQNPIHIKPLHYVHIVDVPTGKFRTVVGPKTLTLAANEQLASNGELKCIILPEGYYCIINNPVIPKSIDSQGFCELQHGIREIRSHETHPNPFPLYLGENLIGKVESVIIIQAGAALLLEAIEDFIEIETNLSRISGEQWLIQGPRSLIPDVRTKVLSVVLATNVEKNHAVRIKAIQRHVDQEGIERIAGEKFLRKEIGLFFAIPQKQEVLKIIKPIILNQTRAIHLRAKKLLVDCCGIERKVGEEWLLTSEKCNSHLLEQGEKLLNVVGSTLLREDEFCVVENTFGVRKIVKGPISFFLSPNEMLKPDQTINRHLIRKMILIEQGEALKLKVLKTTNNNEKVGEIIYKYGPNSIILDEDQFEIVSKLKAWIRVDWFGMYFLYV